MNFFKYKMFMLLSITVLSLLLFVVSSDKSVLSTNNNNQVSVNSLSVKDVKLNQFAYLVKEEDQINFRNLEMEKIEQEKKRQAEIEKRKKEEQKRIEKLSRETKTKPLNTVKITSRSSIDKNENNIEILAKIIYAEAKGEPYKGKLAVGAVILNRVQDKRFPSTIKDVVFQTNQFTPVINGAYANAKPTDSDYKAARETLQGLDPTNGALYFYAPTGTSSRWHETLTYTTTIGGHKFYK